jgi:hypothetical protein
VTIDCDRLAAMAPALAVGALDSDDAAFARAHLAGCPRLHPELREAFDLAAAIGASLPATEQPPPSLRDRILEGARAPVAAPSTLPRPVASPTVVPARTDTWRRTALGAGVLALAASLALAVQLGENRALDERLAATDDRIAALETEIADTEAWMERAVAQGADAFFMEGEGEARDASFMLVVEEEAAGAVLLMSGLPDLDPDETYELWVERDGAVVGVGTFVPDERGLAAMTIDANLAGIRQAMITIEPEGGSDAPNVDGVVMEGELSL